MEKYPAIQWTRKRLKKAKDMHIAKQGLEPGLSGMEGVPFYRMPVVADGPGVGKVSELECLQ